MYKWIVYMQMNFPGNPSFDLTRVRSLREAENLLRGFSKTVMSDDVSASVYTYSDADWSEAERFLGVGCPLDYPDYVLEVGPRGGVRRERA